jgi:hypothetical protein
MVLQHSGPCRSHIVLLHLLRFLESLLVAIRGVTQGIRKGIFEDMFRLGGVSKLCNLLDHPKCSEVAARLLGWITSVSTFRYEARPLRLPPRLEKDPRNLLCQLASPD